MSTAVQILQGLLLFLIDEQLHKFIESLALLRFESYRPSVKPACLLCIRLPCTIGQELPVEPLCCFNPKASARDHSSSRRIFEGRLSPRLPIATDGDHLLFGKLIDKLHPDEFVLIASLETRLDRTLITSGTPLCAVWLHPQYLPSRQSPADDPQVDKALAGSPRSCSDPYARTASYPGVYIESYPNFADLRSQLI